MCTLCTVSWSILLTVTINPKSDVLSAIPFQVSNHRTTHLWGPPSICIFCWHFGTLVNEPSSTTHISSSSWSNGPSKPLRTPSPFMFIVIKHLSCHHSCRFTITDARRCFWCRDTCWVALMERQATKSLKARTLNQHIQLMSITILRHGTQTSSSSIQFLSYWCPVICRIKRGHALTEGLLDLDDEGTAVLQNITNYTHKNTVSHPRRPNPQEGQCQ